jgi:histidinol-phosphate/aromatic aminotransferase/cobyric acid decarboxylase-like protein
VRNVADAVKGCLRVTVGTPRENAKFLDALRDCTEKPS